VEIEELVARARRPSPVLFALPFAVVLTLANLLGALWPGSALLAFVAILIWFPTALALFALVTWARDDEWLTAGLIVGLTPVVARLMFELITRNDLFTTAAPSLGLLVRAVVAVPVCGGVVFGARWLTKQIVEA
jgi:hypothetical protein